MTFLDATQTASAPAIVAAAAALDRELADASPAAVVQGALREIGRDRLAVVSSFGTESAALLKIVADVDPAIPVVFLDTGWLFQETLRRHQYVAARWDRRVVKNAHKAVGDNLAVFNEWHTHAP